MNKQIVFLLVVCAMRVTHTMHTDYKRFTRNNLSFDLELVGKAAKKKYRALHEALNWQQRHVVTISSYVFLNNIDRVIEDINRVLLSAVYTRLNEFDRSLYTNLQNLRTQLRQLRDTVTPHWP